MSPASSPIRLGVPRHLQDCNGYCGPACVMMVRTGSGMQAEAQHEMFRRVREHARQANDRRPVKSPAESLLTLLNGGSRKWEKLFHKESEPVAARILAAVESAGQPCLLMVSSGMHWVVAFGRTRRDDGSVAGILLRDPAWAGMPKFFGLTTLPEKPTFDHTAQDPCTCLSADNPPGSVHERYMAMDELLSPRGLQGSPDWEGKGAIALVPEDLTEAAALPPALPPAAAAPGLTPQAAAMIGVREHGLTGRPDSPPEWQQALQGGQAGTPILVKAPDDPRHDFYLVPIRPAGGSPRTAWIMLDTVTLQLREASLLDHWIVPAFPTDQDAERISNQEQTLPDGTCTRFKKTELRPNPRNLVWKASAASILPYWPLREFVAPHPVTGEPTSIYTDQTGEIHTTLASDHEAEAEPGTQPGGNAREGSVSRPGVKPLVKFAVLAGAAGLVVAAMLSSGGLRSDDPPNSGDRSIKQSELWSAETGPASFSTAFNPNGPWSFGYSSLLGGFTPISSSSTIHGIPAWRQNLLETQTPLVGCNPSDSPVTYKEVTVGPGEMHLHPGPGDEYAILRLTIPRTASYVITGAFSGQDRSPRALTDVHLLVDGKSVWSSTVKGFGEAHGAPFRVTLSLAAGSQLDFAVGSGGSSDPGRPRYYCDSTGLRARVDEQPAGASQQADPPAPLR